MSSNKRVANPYSKGETAKSTRDSRNAATTSRQQITPLYAPAQTKKHTTFSQEFGNFAEQAEHSGSDVASERQGMISSRATITSKGTSTGIGIGAAAACEDPLALQPHVLHVSTKQRGNGILRFIRNVPFAYAKIKPDYILGPNRCALFLSFRYHNLHPNYIHRRIAEIKSDFDLRVLLCLVDVDDNAAIILVLNKICAVNNLTLILAWSEEEAARYLETFKAFEGKDASMIQKKKEVTYPEQVADVLGSVRSVNKTDSAQLVSQFGTLRNVITASQEEIQLCPGIGDKKARRLFDAFNKPFSSAMSKRRKLEQKKAAVQETGPVDDNIQETAEDANKDETILEEKLDAN